MHISYMNSDSSRTNPEPEEGEEIDDPYIHTVSTEEFVETVEQASQKEVDEEVAPNRD